jgi:hypothetical protein
LEAELSSTVRVDLPDVYRAPGGALSILPVVYKMTDGRFQKLVTINRILTQLVTAAEVAKVKTSLLSVATAQCASRVRRAHVYV